MDNRKRNLSVLLFLIGMAFLLLSLEQMFPVFIRRGIVHQNGQLFLHFQPDREWFLTLCGAGLCFFTVVRLALWPRRSGWGVGLSPQKQDSIIVSQLSSETRAGMWCPRVPMTTKCR